MKENESKPYVTRFGKVTSEDYEQSQRRSFSLHADTQTAQTTTKKTNRKKTKKQKLFTKDFVLGLIFPDGLVGKSQSEYGMDSYEAAKFGSVSTVILVALLIGFGIIMIASSSYYAGLINDGDPFSSLKKQAINLLAGFGALMFCRLVPFKFFQRASFFAYLGSVFLCVLVLFVGKTVNGSTRWFDLGFASFQPSEVAKIGVILYVSALTEKYHDTIRDFKVFALLSLVILVPVGVVALENLSTAIIIAVIGFTIIIVGGCDVVHCLLIFVFVLIVGCVFLIWPAIRAGVNIFTTDPSQWGYRVQRLITWLDPWKDATGDGYQMVQSLYAVGSGGFFGRGLGESIQKLGYIPEAYNDIIFAVICEEMGLVGAGLVLATFGLFAFQGYNLSERNPNIFGSCVIAGVTSMISVQAIINIGVAVGAIPTTGASLPFISYGGSSVFFLLAGVGLMLSASRYSRIKELQQ